MHTTIAARTRHAIWTTNAVIATMRGAELISTDPEREAMRQVGNLS